MRLGFPSDEIDAVIEDQPIHLVVMGMKGKGTLEKMMGSTTTSTIKKVKKPILVVPEHASYSEIKQVTYATDFSYTVDFHVYDPLLELLKSYDARLHIVHVQKKADAETAGFPGSGDGYQTGKGNLDQRTGFRWGSYEFSSGSDSRSS